MGWKLAIAVFPLKGRSLEKAVFDFYGTKRNLEPSAETVERVLYPKDQKIAYACEQGGRAWIFDWPFVLNVFDKGFAGGEDALFYLLQSTTNLYGFARYESGTERRRRAGSSDDGIYVDNGELDSAERREIVKLAGFADEAEALKVWMDSEHVLEGPDDELTHDALGEEIVFALMESHTGVRFDQPSEEGDALFEKAVLSIKKPKLFGIL